MLISRISYSVICFSIIKSLFNVDLKTVGITSYSFTINLDNVNDLNNFHRFVRHNILFTSIQFFFLLMLFCAKDLFQIPCSKYVFHRFHHIPQFLFKNKILLYQNQFYSNYNIHLIYIINSLIIYSRIYF